MRIFGPGFLHLQCLSGRATSFFNFWRLLWRIFGENHIECRFCMCLKVTNCEIFLSLRFSPFLYYEGSMDRRLWHWNKKSKNFRFGHYFFEVFLEKSLFLHILRLD
jgi:hypothetical protein